MKNDIDSILNSLFSGGKLHVGENTQSRAAREAEEFLKSIEQKDRRIGDSLNRQLGDLEKINSEAQKSMEEMRRLLENDAVPAEKQPEEAEKKPTAKGAEEPPRVRVGGGDARGPPKQRRCRVTELARALTCQGRRAPAGPGAPPFAPGETGRAEAARLL